jgi:hypothetical protein
LLPHMSRARIIRTVDLNTIDLPTVTLAALHDTTRPVDW